MIVTRTPLRISLTGGGTDLPSFYEKDPNVPGAVISLTINKYVYVVLNPKFDGNWRISYSRTENVEKPYQIEHDLIRESISMYAGIKGLEVVTVADIPGSGSGLGSSSTLTVGLLKALNYLKGIELHPGQLAEMAYEVEALRCDHPVGKQDHYSAAYGGLNFFRFWKDKVECHGGGEGLLYTDSIHLEELQKYFLLLWTGKTRSANSILVEQSKSMSLNEQYAIGKAMVDVTLSMLEDLSNGEIGFIGNYLDQNWSLKKRLHPLISSPEIDNLYRTAMQNGALGGKLCGAGGGGFLLFFAPPETHDRIAQSVALPKIPFGIELEGSKVIYAE